MHTGKSVYVNKSTNIINGLCNKMLFNMGSIFYLIVLKTEVKKSYLNVNIIHDEMKKKKIYKFNYAD